MPLGIGVEEETRFGNGRLLADAGHHVLKRPLLGRVIMDIVGRQDGAAIGASDPVQPFDPGSVAAAIKPGRRDVTERWNGVTKPWKLGFERIEIVRRPGDEGDAVAMRGDVVEAQLAFTLVRAHLAEAQ